MSAKQTFIEFWKTEVANAEYPYEAQRNIVLDGIQQLSKSGLAREPDNVNDVYIYCLEQAHFYAAHDQYFAAAQAITVGFKALKK